MKLREVFNFVEKMPRRRWRLLVASALVVGLIGLVCGQCVWSTKLQCMSLIAGLVSLL